MTIRIVSGGQTGADRAALDWAIQNGFDYGGWCPRGRKAEDGIIGPQYRLGETPSAQYDQRTEWNVRDSDATVIFSLGKNLWGGSKYTAEMAQKHRKPLLQLCRASDTKAAEQLKQFLRHHRVRVLNIAGPRASEEPAVAAFVRATLELALKPHACRKRL